MPHWGACQLDPFNSVQQRVEDRDGLESSDMLPDALVDSHSEPDVPGGIAIEVEAIWIAPSPRIPVRGAEEHQHLALGWNRYAGDLDGSGRGAEEGLHRGF